ncbi:MAG: Ig domain-containing protein [Synergistaceae bacterium]|nr:Ig domain-containing protein [Synergistaceae bacterium]
MSELKSLEERGRGNGKKEETNEGVIHDMKETKTWGKKAFVLFLAAVMALTIVPLTTVTAFAGNIDEVTITEFKPAYGKLVGSVTPILGEQTYDLEDGDGITWYNIRGDKVESTDTFREEYYEAVIFLRAENTDTFVEKSELTVKVDGTTIDKGDLVLVGDAGTNGNGLKITVEFPFKIEKPVSFDVGVPWINLTPTDIEAPHRYGGVTSFDVSDFSWLKSNGTVHSGEFLEGDAYTVKIELAASSEVRAIFAKNFDSRTNPTASKDVFEGLGPLALSEKVTISDDVKVGGKFVDDLLTFFVMFPPVEAKVVDHAISVDIAAPRTGVTGGNAVKGADVLRFDVDGPTTWQLPNGAPYTAPFEEAGTYTAKVVLTTDILEGKNPEYKFDKAVFGSDIPARSQDIKLTLIDGFGSGRVSDDVRLDKGDKELTFFVMFDAIPVYEINPVSVDIVAPSGGIKSDEAFNDGDPEAFYVDSTEWYDDDGEELELGEKFVVGTKYTATIVLAAKQDHKFAPTLNSGLNPAASQDIKLGELALLGEGVVSDDVSLTEDGKTLTFHVMFKETDYTRIEALTVSLDHTLRAGNLLPDVEPVTDGFNAAVVWNSTDTRFKVGESYRATFTLNTDEEFLFEGVSSGEITVLGLEDGVISDDVVPADGSGDSLEFYVNFGPVKALEIDDIVVSLDQPVAGVPNAPAEVGEDKKFTVSDTLWAITNGAAMGPGDTFKENTAYTATVFLKPVEFYEFSEDVTPDNITLSPPVGVVSDDVKVGDDGILRFYVDFVSTTELVSLDRATVNIKAPEAREDSGAVGLPDEANYKVTSEGWATAAGEKLETGKPFAAETFYTNTVVLTANPGYKFEFAAGQPVSTDITVNPSLKVLDIVDISSTVSTLTFKVLFDETGEPETVNTFTAAITAPVERAVNAQAVPVSEGFAVDSTTWTGGGVTLVSGDMFEANTAYTATVKLTATAGWEFKADVKSNDITVNTAAGRRQGDVNVIESSIDTLTFSVLFTNTGAASPITEGIVVNLAKPVVGAQRGTAATTGETYKVTSTGWAPNHTTFAGETVYAATILLTANPGYEFGTVTSGDIKGTVADTGNTIDAITVPTDKKTLEFRVTFPETAPERPVITTTSLHDGKVRVAYTANLAATGTGPITWGLEAGSALPAGLTLASGTGAISGTPTTSGDVYFVVEATNASGVTSKDFRIHVRAEGEETSVGGEDEGWKVVIGDSDLNKIITDPLTGDIKLLEPVELTLETFDDNGNLTQTLVLTFPAGAVINAETGYIVLEAGGAVENEDGLEIMFPNGTEILPDGSVMLPSGDDVTLEVKTSDENVEVSIEDIFSLKFDEDGMIELLAGAATEKMTITAGTYEIKLNKGMMYQQAEDAPPVVVPGTVNALSVKQALFINVVDEPAEIVVDGKTIVVPVGKTIKITTDDDGNQVVTFDEDSKKSSGCSTGAGAMLALLALAGMSFVSKRRR